MLFRTLLFIVLSLHVLKLNAGVVKDVYVGRVEVSDQASRTLQRANISAMRQVLVKISGDPQSLSHDQIKRALQQAANYIRSYSFERDEGRLIYRVEFDIQGLQRLLLGAGFSIWDNLRPDTMFWIATEAQATGQRDLVSENSTHELLNTIKQTAQQRGIPVSFPLMDLDDMQAVNLYDIWGGFTDVIRAASDRYSPEYIVTARVYFQKPQEVAPASTAPDESLIPVYAIDSVKETRTPTAIEELVEQLEQQQGDIEPGWVGDYQIIFGDSIERGRLQGDSPQDIVRNITENLADMLATTYAFRNQGLSEDDKVIDITITNVEDLETLVTVKSFLSGLSVVAKADLREQTVNASTFTLELIGNRQDLLNALRLDDKIRPTLDEFGRETQLMRYYWAR